MENKRYPRFALLLVLIQLTGQRTDYLFGFEARETAQGRYWTFRK